jgi:hypothetical protein
MVTTWLEDIPRSDRRHITVQNGSDSDSMVANVRVYLTVLHGFLTDENCVALELGIPSKSRTDYAGIQSLTNQRQESNWLSGEFQELEHCHKAIVIRRPHV